MFFQTENQLKLKCFLSGQFTAHVESCIVCWYKKKKKKSEMQYCLTGFGVVSWSKAIAQCWTLDIDASPGIQVHKGHVG